MTPAKQMDRPLDPTLSQRWRRVRFPIGVTVGLVLAAIALTVLSGQSSRGYLDPEGVNISGARALVRLLEDAGVEVTEARTADDAVNATAGDDTLLVTDPDRLLPGQVDRLSRTGADIVLVEPERTEEFAPQLHLAGQAGEHVLEPRCDLPVAERAGSARLGGLSYQAPTGATICYPVDPGDDTGSLVVTTTATNARLVVLGDSAPLTNRYLDQDGNAALALGLLGQNQRLTWYRPTLEAPGGAEQSFTDLMPAWVAPVMWQLAIAALLAAWWRARRLGPVVQEPLPVVVRAAEATEGRARLYRRGRSRGHAAATLRDAAVRRLRRRLGVPAVAPVTAVIDAASARSTSDPDAVATLLAGPDPADDAGLVRLADSLDALEQEVRSS